VTAGATPIPDGGAYNIGSTTQGTPLVQTITVTNAGSVGPLNLLTDPPTVTGDFSVTNFTGTSIAAFASVTFDLTCLATTPGAPNTGTISFANNDFDENPTTSPSVHCHRFTCA